MLSYTSNAHARVMGPEEPLPDEDPIGLAHELASVLTELQLDPDASKWDEIRRAAHTTSQQYCEKNTKEAVMGFWRKHLNG